MKEARPAESLTASPRRIDLALPDEAATAGLARVLGRSLEVGDLLALEGPLGVGKTALARALIQAVKGGDPAEAVPSPTFTLLQTYQRRPPLWHFDLYRLAGPEEVWELGWEEARDEAALLVEWPERLGTLLPADRLHVALAFDAEGGAEARRVCLTGHGLWAERLTGLALPGALARDAEISDFLARAGGGRAARQSLAADASFRRYERLLRGNGETAVLMDAPPDKEKKTPTFLALARKLSAVGLHAPAVLAEEIERGLLLLEDFGDRSFTRALADGADETALYRLATDTLIALKQRLDAEDGRRIGLGAYDREAYQTEAGLLTEWTWPALFGRPCPPEVQASYVAAWDAVLPLLEGTPFGIVLRDFHVDNLFLLGAGARAPEDCGLLDFQDALVGPLAYDLVSLLEDARRDLAPGLKEEMIAAYLARAAEADPEHFRQACEILSAQRNCKIIGIFTRLDRRDGKPDYLRHIPRVWRLLEGNLRHPALAPVADWFAQHWPAEARRAPAPLAETPA